MSILELTTHQRIPMAVRFLPKTEIRLEAMVEFYDRRYPFTAYGQFIGRYYLHTLLDRNPVGLCLDGGHQCWNLDADDFSQVQAWLKEVTTQ
jgi:hypothetical protein